jgi:hypothetical protein
LHSYIESGVCIQERYVSVVVSDDYITFKVPCQGMSSTTICIQSIYFLSSVANENCLKREIAILSQEKSFYHRMGIVTAARAVYRAGKAIAVISKAGLALFDGPA